MTASDYINVSSATIAIAPSAVGGIASSYVNGRDYPTFTNTSNITCSFNYTTGVMTLTASPAVSAATMQVAASDRWIHQQLVHRFRDARHRVHVYGYSVCHQ